MTDKHPQIILAAHARVAQMQTTEDGLVIQPGVDKPISREAAVNRATRELTAELSEGSALWKTIDRMEGAKKFVGTVTRVTREKSSTRGIVELYTGTDRETQGVDLGYEKVRTDRTDSDSGLMVASEAKSLIGHRVLVYMVLEETSRGNTKVRVLVHLNDLGVDDRYDPDTRKVIVQG